MDRRASQVVKDQREIGVTPGTEVPRERRLQVDAFLPTVSKEDPKLANREL